MTDKQIFFYTVIASSVIHVAIIGAMGGLFSVPSSEPVFITQVVKMDSKKTPLLPEIKVMGEFKQLKSIDSQQYMDSGQKNKPEKNEDKAFKKKTEAKKISAIDREVLTAGQKIVASEKARELMLRYQDMVKQRIESYRCYPLRAQRIRIEGVVGLAFVINADGSSQNVRVVKSSGSKLLDTEAVKTIQKASPFLPLPQEIKRTTVDICVAIVFSLG